MSRSASCRSVGRRVSRGLSCAAVALLLAGCGGGERSTSDNPCSRLQLAGATSCVVEGSPIVRLELFNVDGPAVCSGVLVSARHVLTAAHCFDGILGLPTVVFADGTSTVTLNASVTEEFFSERHVELDFAIVEVDEAATVERGIHPLKIFHSLDRPAHGETVTVAGYGVQPAGGAPSETPRAVLLEVTENEGRGYFIARPLGAGSTCRGDSGGPALVQLPVPQHKESDTKPLEPEFGVVGIVSAGAESSECSATASTLFASTNAPSALRLLALSGVTPF